MSITNLRSYTTSAGLALILSAMKTKKCRMWAWAGLVFLVWVWKASANRHSWKRAMVFYLRTSPTMHPTPVSAGMMQFTKHMFWILKNLYHSPPLVLYVDSDSCEGTQNSRHWWLSSDRGVYGAQTWLFGTTSFYITIIVFGAHAHWTERPIPGIFATEYMYRYLPREQAAYAISFHLDGSLKLQYDSLFNDALFLKEM